jgi:hypothetical protein
MNSTYFKRLACSILMLSALIVTQGQAEQQEFPVTRDSELLHSHEHETECTEAEEALHSHPLTEDLVTSPAVEAEENSLSLVSPEEMVQSTGAALVSCTDHWIAEFPSPNVIRLGDGSEWTFNPSDLYIIRSWRVGDKLDMCPKTNFFWSSDYSYVITNRSQPNSTSLDVNPSLGPVRFGRFSVWVQGIDNANRHLFVTTGEGEKTTWVIHKNDETFFRNVVVNSHLIIMNNADIFWWFSPFNRILVHVEFNQQLHARQL